MKVEYICHACLFIDTGDVKIVTDPWFNGPAYSGQWHVFPKPVNTDALDQAQVILLSHGHEDHLHPRTLRKLPRRASVFYPYNWYGGIEGLMKRLEFSNVTEAVTNREYQLGKNTSVTYIANHLDSVIVIESGGQVLVDVNDALHASHPGVIDLYIKIIKKRWPRINTVFCGFGGASYFPNTIHCPGKDDYEIGRLREQLFAHNFCRIVQGLAPEVAVPFAADFALLAPQQRWISSARFPRSYIASYYREHFANGSAPVSIYDMYPGDVLNGNQLEPRSPYRTLMKEGRLDHLVDGQYAREIAQLQEPSAGLPESDAVSLREEILSNVRRRCSLFDSATLNRLQFCVRVSDIGTNNCYNISFVSGVPEVIRGQQPAPGSLLVMDISSRVLRYSFRSDWGGDAITIGYGSEIHVSDPSTVEARLDTICVLLLTRQPSMKRHIAREPVRVARHVISNPPLRSWVINKALGRKRPPIYQSLNVLYDSSIWIARTKCEICRACDLPLLTDEFASQIG